jgi:uncharacterized protein (TIGR02300 family)
VSALAKSSDPKGLKRVCVSCGVRFYDFNKRPIKCPNCSTEFTGEIKLKSRRGRAAIEEDAVPAKSIKSPANDDGDDDVVAAQEDTVSLEDIEEDGAAEDEDEAADADLELDDDLEDLDEEELDDLEDIEEDAEEPKE